MDVIQWVSDARSIVTLICMSTFIGIVIWAYSAARKQDFDEAAMLPFADDESLNTKTQEPHHG
jgi:cytochrome c oxidase cbb3-type subunit IV